MLASSRMSSLLWLLVAQSVIGPVESRPASSSQWTSSLSQVYHTTNKLPVPNYGGVEAHDPNIIRYGDSLYLFKGGHHVPIYKAADISGPWTQIGTVLGGDSIIPTGNRDRPWAPTTIERNGIFYCYYTLSSRGSQISAIGVATTTDIDGRPWTDHGAVIRSGTGPHSQVWPFNITNAIDPSFITDEETGKSYLNYGSFWHNIWQLPMSDDLLSIEEPGQPDAVQLTFIPHLESKPQEGSWMTYRDGWYYVWFSHGRCCHFNEKGFPPRGEEYSIRVGRSRSVRGPFVDKENQLLTKDGGTVVYGSNHGLAYAPGGVGVLPGNETTPDILYYHYLNTTVGFNNQDAHLGWNWLRYEEGWPMAVAFESFAAVGQTSKLTTADANSGLTLTLPSWPFLTTLTCMLKGYGCSCGHSEYLFWCHRDSHSVF